MVDKVQGPEVAVLSTTVNTDNSYVDWCAVIAGAAIASAISFVLFTFGTGIGLSIASPYPAESVSPVIFAIVLALWILVVTIISFLTGGYFTGVLMKRRIGAEHETEMRDGMHGALTWAVAVILGALITAWTVAGVAKSGTEAGASAVAAVATGDQAQAMYFADSLLRTDDPAAVVPAETDSRRGEISRLLLRNPGGDVSPADRTYLSRLVMRQSGLAEAEAAARVETVVGEFRAAVTKAQEAAEKARKYALLLAFAVASTLALGAAAAWWAAVQGGEQRDQGFDFRPHIGWQPKNRLR
jgi:hypothetical protein